MSMPSSSALVATTQRTSPARRPCSMRGASRAGSRRGSLTMARIDALGDEAVAQVLEHGLDCVARSAEDQRGHLGAHEVVRERTAGRV
jgi:hypothetical protein